MTRVAVTDHPRPRSLFLEMMSGPEERSLAALRSARVTVADDDAATALRFGLAAFVGTDFRAIYETGGAFIIDEA